jgi:hypothetical protein
MEVQMKRWNTFLITSTIGAILTFLVITILTNISYNKELGHRLDSETINSLYNSWISEYILWVILIAISVGALLGGIAVLIIPHTSKNFENIDPENFPKDISYNDLRALYKKKYKS